MAIKLETTMQGLNDIKNDLAAYEMRKQHILKELESGHRQKDLLQKEMDESRALFKRDMDARLASLAEERTKLSQEKATLDSQKQEFKEILTKYQQDRIACESEKASAIAIKENYAKMSEKVGLFVQAVRKEAEKL